MCKLQYRKNTIQLNTIQLITIRKIAILNATMQFNKGNLARNYNMHNLDWIINVLKYFLWNTHIMKYSTKINSSIDSNAAWYNKIQKNIVQYNH